MKYRTEFRLVVQLIAVYLVASKLVSFLGSAGSAFLAIGYQRLVAESVGAPGVLEAFGGQALLIVLSSFLSIGLGVLLFIKADWVSRLALRHGERGVVSPTE